jgi:hypothetical protein
MKQGPAVTDAFAQLGTCARQMQKAGAALDHALTQTNPELVCSPHIAHEFLLLSCLESRIQRLHLAVLWESVPQRRDAVLAQCQLVVVDPSGASSVPVWLDDPTFLEDIGTVRLLLQQQASLSTNDFASLIELVANIAACVGAVPLVRTAYDVEQGFYRQLFEAFFS